MVLSAMSDDAEKSIKTMTEETNGEFDKMEILGELKKSNEYSGSKGQGPLYHRKAWFTFSLSEPCEDLLHRAVAGFK